MRRRWLIAGGSVLIIAVIGWLLLVPLADAYIAQGCGPIPKPDAGTRQIARTHTKLSNGDVGFFPVGIYHVSWAGDAAERQQALERIAAGNFNLMYAALQSGDRAFLDEAERLGVQVIVEHYDPSGLETVMTSLDDHPAVYAWLTADDFNSPQRDHTPHSVQQTNNLVKSLTLDNSTYMSGGTQRLRRYENISDMIGIQTYTIPDEPLIWVDSALSCVTNRVPNESIIANLQTYAFPGKRPPTVAEVNAATYLALVNGVDGLLYYAYFSDDWDMEDHPELWAGLTQTVGEVRTLEPFLLNGNLTKRDSGQRDVRIGQWAYNGQTLTVIVNATNNTKSNFELPMASTITYQNTPIGERLSLAGGTLRGDLAPYAVHVLLSD